MAWTDPVRYPNSLEESDPQGALNTYVIDNVENLGERVTALESGGGSGSSDVILFARTNTPSSVTLSTEPWATNPWNYVYKNNGCTLSESDGSITLPSTGYYSFNVTARFVVDNYYPVSVGVGIGEYGITANIEFPNWYTYNQDNLIVSVVGDPAVSSPYSGGVSGLLIKEITAPTIGVYALESYSGAVQWSSMIDLEIRKIADFPA